MLIRVLGPVDVVDDDGTVHASTSALPAYVVGLFAMHAGRVLAPEWLLEHVWDGDVPGSGLRALRFHISQLRREVGHADLIETCPGGYRLRVAAGDVDVGAVESLVGAARAEVDDERAARLCTEALALWRGEPFVDVAPTSDLADEAVRLEDLRLTLTELGYRRRFDAGEGAELVPGLLRLTGEHPLREALWHVLIAAQYGSGRQADALRSYESLRSILVETLGVDPSPELRDLQRRVLDQEPTLSAAPARPPGEVGLLLRDVEASTSLLVPRGQAGVVAALPVPVTPLVGRRDDIERIARLVERDDVRLVTITGSGGTGKTRVALELARSIGHRFANGAVFVELAPLRDPGLVLSAIARQLGLVESIEPTVVSLARRLRTLELLVVVDNVEHVIDAAPELAGLLRDTERVTILATSRRVLHVGGEHVYTLEPLPEHDAERLFIDRMAAAGRSDADDDVDGVIGAICRRVEGLPLAVELAAARTTTMSPAVLLARLGDRVTVLGVGPATHRRANELSPTPSHGAQRCSPAPSSEHSHASLCSPAAPPSTRPRRWLRRGPTRSRRSSTPACFVASPSIGPSGSRCSRPSASTPRSAWTPPTVPPPRQPTPATTSRCSTG